MAKKKAKKAVKKTAKAKKAVRKAAKKTTKKKVAKKPVKAKKKSPAAGASVRAGATKNKVKRQIVGEGDYAATRAFDKDQAGFVKKNKARIPALGKAAEAALEGPEGEALRAAEVTAAARSRDTF